MTSRHQCQGRTRKLEAASLKSLGNALASAITLNRIYHCVPRIIRELSHIFGASSKCTIRKTATGKSRFAGEGGEELGDCLDSLRQFGRNPTATPIGTR